MMIGYWSSNGKTHYIDLDNNKYYGDSSYVDVRQRDFIEIDPKKYLKLKVLPHFTLGELTCKCGCNGYVHNPNFLFHLDLIRKRYGKAMVISSATRCSKHNKAVGGSATSDHLTMNAVDVAVSNDRDRFLLIKKAILVGFDRIGVSKGFVHLGLSDNIKDKPEMVLWTY